MNRELYIHTLRMLREQYEIARMDTVVETIDAALAEFERPTDSDCISRQAAIDAADRSDYTGLAVEDVKKVTDEVVKELKKLPSAQPDLDSAYTEGYTAAESKYRKMWDEMQATQPEPHWIPCSERLPEEDTEVLISYRYKKGEGDTDHVNIDITSYGTTCFGGREIHTLKEWRQPFDYFHANYEVIAWMPLPEPWKGENHVTD